jgi:hypothetical protein
MDPRDSFGSVKKSLLPGWKWNHDFWVHQPAEAVINLNREAGLEVGKEI